MKKEKKDKEFVNPIDPDKITENPHSLEYGHHVGSAVIKAEDVGKQKGRALAAMEHQTDQQLNQIYWQIKPRRSTNEKRFLNVFIRQNSALNPSLITCITSMRMRTLLRY